MKQTAEREAKANKLVALTKEALENTQNINASGERVQETTGIMIKPLSICALFPAVNSPSNTHQIYVDLVEAKVYVGSEELNELGQKLLSEYKRVDERFILVRNY